MKFGKRILLPSYTRKKDYRSWVDEDRDYYFGCVRCSAEIPISFQSTIGAIYWSHRYDPQTVELIRKHFDLNLVGKSHDDGWPAVFQVACQSCELEYLVYAGVDEVSNSVYTVVIQGISEIVGNPGL